LSESKRWLNFSERGTPRDDIRPGLRTVPFRRRVTIVYAVAPEEVRVVGVFYAGQDFKALLQDPDEAHEQAPPNPQHQ
jgi:toxin ParE1/3/4